MLFGRFYLCTCLHLLEQKFDLSGKAAQVRLNRSTLCVQCHKIWQTIPIFIRKPPSLATFPFFSCLQWVDDFYYIIKVI
jgi:hypothetical protein